MANILIIDDSSALQVLLKVFLQNKGHKTETASRKIEIEERLVNFYPDIILLDVCLHGENGREVCRAIKLRTTGKQVYVILFSAGLAFLQHYTECNAEAIIQKPFELKQVTDKIRGITATSENIQQQTEYDQQYPAVAPLNYFL